MKRLRPIGEFHDAQNYKLLLTVNYHARRRRLKFYMYFMHLLLLVSLQLLVMIVVLHRILMAQIATFLAIGPQIYVDGLVIINESKKPIGSIGSKHIISNILRIGYPDWLETTAEQIMDDFAGTIDMNSPLSKAIEVFDKTRFAFVPIIAKDDGGSEAAEVVASLSIRDILPLIAKTNINRSIKDLALH